ncbi:MAG: hypothetical protein AABZ47_10425 [Planctomycetota bacterium]
MRSYSVILIGIVAMTLHGSASWSHALPPDFTLVWKIHDTPSDPNTPVVFAVTSTLRATSKSGNSIGWEVLNQAFQRVNSGTVTALWREEQVNVETHDGLWWVAHADPSTPVVGDFTTPPEMWGVATAITSGEQDLEFNMEGTGTPPPNPPPYLEMGNMRWWFYFNYGQYAEWEDDEPAEAGDSDDVIS